MLKNFYCDSSRFYICIIELDDFWSEDTLIFAIVLFYHKEDFEIAHEIGKRMSKSILTLSNFYTAI